MAYLIMMAIGVIATGYGMYWKGYYEGEKGIKSLNIEMVQHGKMHQEQQYKFYQTRICISKNH